ncbi:hypothetical protein FIBSPDRAFT_903005 [Athelia psychrophila]|uniref:Uncharacterized protein n=1 Tax=Athelia psychrophila TaxID=1759441 RepID=A0A167WIH6_9AGAM|nr:hypothetical protein FIBSPDRAFT_903005 [Fibularhizoctonia sp. CBS 109695]
MASSATYNMYSTSGGSVNNVNGDLTYEGDLLNFQGGQTNIKGNYQTFTGDQNNIKGNYQNFLGDNQNIHAGKGALVIKSEEAPKALQSSPPNVYADSTSRSSPTAKILDSPIPLHPQSPSSALRTVQPLEQLAEEVLSLQGEGDGGTGSSPPKVYVDSTSRSSPTAKILDPPIPPHPQSPPSSLTAVQPLEQLVEGVLSLQGEGDGGTGSSPPKVYVDSTSRSSPTAKILDPPIPPHPQSPPSSLTAVQPLEQLVEGVLSLQGDGGTGSSPPKVYADSTSKCSPTAKILDLPIPPHPQSPPSALRMIQLPEQLVLSLTPAPLLERIWGSFKYIWADIQREQASAGQLRALVRSIAQLLGVLYDQDCLGNLKDSDSAPLDELYGVLENINQFLFKLQTNREPLKLLLFKCDRVAQIDAYQDKILQNVSDRGLLEKYQAGFFVY